MELFVRCINKRSVRLPEDEVRVVGGAVVQAAGSWKTSVQIACKRAGGKASQQCCL